LTAKQVEVLGLARIGAVDPANQGLFRSCPGGRHEGRTTGGSMNTRNWLAVASGALALGTFSILGGAYTAPHAHAQSLAQARQVTSAARPRLAVSSAFTICLFDAGSECLRSHGGGSQLTIESSDYAVFHIVNNGVGNLLQMEDSGGKCLRSYAAGSVGLALGGCSTSTDDEWWNFSTDTQGRSTLFQYGAPGTTPQFMGTYGKSSGLGVWMDEPHQGFYAGWKA
jgi:hypothetical protein